MVSRRLRAKLAAGGVAAIGVLALAAAQGDVTAGRGGGPVLRTVGTFDQPMYVHGPRGAPRVLFVVERKGTIRVLKNGKRHGTLLDIRGLVRCCDGERGLFSVAFPGWRESRRFYVFFTDAQGDLRISEFKRKPGRPLRASRKSRRDLLEIRHRTHANHNGGQLQWGPDGRLYIATGDGGGGGDPGENAQDKGSLLGKILRIDPLRHKAGRRYGIPRDNPYVGRRGRREIFSRGLRNPWRFSFNRRKIVIGDVGQSRFEEVDYERLGRAKGANFGWDNYEGNDLFEGPALRRHDRPIHTYSHSGGRCSITGGYVVRDRDLGGLRGRYLYGDLCTGEIRSLVPRLGGARRDRATGLSRNGIVSFGEDARRNIYVVAGNRVHRIR